MHGISATTVCGERSLIAPAPPERLKVPPGSPSVDGYERGVLRAAAVGAGEHVWTYDFVEDRTRDRRKFRMLNVVDEFTRECLSIRVAHTLGSADVVDVLADFPGRACVYCGQGLDWRRGCQDGVH